MNSLPLDTVLTQDKVLSQRGLGLGESWDRE